MVFDKTLRVRMIDRMKSLKADYNIDEKNQKIFLWGPRTWFGHSGKVNVGS